jgi:site-specific recombinase XerD
MQNALVRFETTERALGPLSQIENAARDFIGQAKAANTKRAYRAGWKHFTNWCVCHRLIPMPATPETVVLYLSDLASTHKTSTLTLRVSAISQAHQFAGHESPTQTAAVRSVMAGIRRTKGTAPETKTAALTEDIRAMVAATPDTPKGSRDRTLLLIGFAGGFRRSELVGLNYEDLGFVPEGLVISLRRSKTDQEAQGRKVAIPYGSNPDTCPVRTLQAWLKVSGIAAGPLFRAVTAGGRVRSSRLCDRVVALTVKRYARACGRDARQFAGHSLRAGLATSAAIGGASERSIMAQTGHRSVNMVRRYIRDGSLFRDNAAAKIGL